MPKCFYCRTTLARKRYPGGQEESDERFYDRKYCDLKCYSKGRIYESAKNNYKIIKNQRELDLKHIED